MDGLDHHPVTFTFSLNNQQTSLNNVYLFIHFMASLAHHLPSLFLLTLLYTSVNGNSVETSNTGCRSFNCGNSNGLVIGYPFWAQDHYQSEFCGYPGFGLSCSDQQPMLHLSGHHYRVKKIDFSKNTLTVAYSDIMNNSVCPVAPHGVTLNISSFLNYTTTDNKLLCFFYNCTLYPPSLPSIECLQYGAKRSYAFTMGAIPEFDWQRYCESTVTVPVVDKAVDHGLLVNSFAGALHGGFKLKWRLPDSECQSCEASGGFCGYSDGLHQKFVCFCTDGQHSSDCHDTGGLSVTFRPNFMSTGAIIFGSLITTSTVFYFTQKKKIATQKPTFSRIPNSTGK